MISERQRRRYRVVRQVASAYGIRIERLSPCHSLYATNVAFRIQTPRRTVLIKPFRGTELKLSRLFRQLRELQRHNYRYAPTWLVTKAHRPWVRKGQTLFYATEWVEGNVISQRDEELMGLGAALAQLHSISRRINTKRPPLRNVQSLQDQARRFRRSLPILETRTDEIGRWFQANGQTCKRLSEEAWEILKRARVASVLRRKLKEAEWIHGDVTRLNVIASDKGIKLIDWDGMREGCALLELAKALANTTNFSPSSMQSVLRGYETHLPLCAEEKQIIQAFFRLPREAWIVAHKLSAHRSKPGFTLLANTWSSRLEAIAWLDKWVTTAGGT